MNIKRKYINTKTGKIRESNLTERQAFMHGYVPYEEPKVAKIVEEKVEEDATEEINVFDEEPQPKKKRTRKTKS